MKDIDINDSAASLLIKPALFVIALFSLIAMLTLI